MFGKSFMEMSLNVPKTTIALLYAYLRDKDKTKTSVCQPQKGKFVENRQLICIRLSTMFPSTGLGNRFAKRQRSLSGETKYEEEKLCSRRDRDKEKWKLKITERSQLFIMDLSIVFSSQISFYFFSSFYPES